jgi:1-phosphofructokinase family hexose kinase
VIHCFGGETIAVLISGGEAGKRLEEHLRCDGLPFRVVPVANEIRTNQTITDRHGLTVNLNEKGPEVSKAEVALVESTVKEMLDKATWLMVCGSIPPGVPSTLYGRLIAAARKKKVNTLLHADGESLRLGIEERPTVVTPNHLEAERLLGRNLLTRTHYLDAAERIRTMGPESVVLSLGSRGAVGAFRDGLVEAVPPRVDAVCPIGSGDALSAAYTWSM